MHVTPRLLGRQPGADGGGEFFEKVFGAGIADLIDGVEAQTVEAILPQPVQGVLDDEIADRPRGVVDGAPPGGVDVGVEEARRIGVEVVSVRSEVIVDDVEKDRQAAGVGFVYEPLQIVRRAVDGVGREVKHAVVAPVARPGKIGDRHQFNGRDAEVH
jgi:hypothetical protein